MAERPSAVPSDPQEHLLAFLSDGRSYGLPSAEVERITTHAAQVFLVGKNAYKMKRAVRYSFLDFTTLDRRKGRSKPSSS
jgi:aminoglycoside phosphotransferase family enzyme